MQSELLKGTLATLILKILAEKGRMYGYELSQLVKERSQGQILLKEGSLYPMLHKMLAEGLIESQEEYIGKRVRRYYQVTAVGQERAQQQVNQLLDFFTLMENLLLTPQVPAYGHAQRTAD